MILETYIELDISVDFTVYPGSTGSRDSYGAPLEPDEPTTIEINSVEYNGKDILQLLPESELRRIEQGCFEEALEWKEKP